MIWNSLAEWSVGYCVGENGKQLIGELQKGKFAPDECAFLCSEDTDTTACEYDLEYKTCTVHTQTVTSSYHPVGLDNFKRCTMILPQGMSHTLHSDSFLNLHNHNI